MCSNRFNTSLIHHKDLVSILNGTDSLCNNNHSRILCNRLQCSSQLLVCPVIQCRERIIKQIDGGSADNCSCDCKPLPLPARKVCSPFGNLHLKTTFVFLHELLCLRNRKNLPEFFLCCIRFSIPQIVLQCPRKQESLLWNHADCLIKLMP